LSLLLFSLTRPATGQWETVFSSPRQRRHPSSLFLSRRRRSSRNLLRYKRPPFLLLLFPTSREGGQLEADPATPFSLSCGWSFGLAGKMKLWQGSLGSPSFFFLLSLPCGRNEREVVVAGAFPSLFFSWFCSDAKPPQDFPPLFFLLFPFFFPQSHELFVSSCRQLSPFSSVIRKRWLVKVGLLRHRPKLLPTLFLFFRRLGKKIGGPGGAFPSFFSQSRARDVRLARNAPPLPPVFFFFPHPVAFANNLPYGDPWQACPVSSPSFFFFLRCTPGRRRDPFLAFLPGLPAPGAADFLPFFPGRVRPSPARPFSFSFFFFLFVSEIGNPLPWPLPSPFGERSEDHPTLTSSSGSSGRASNWAIFLPSSRRPRIFFLPPSPFLFCPSLKRQELESRSSFPSSSFLFSTLLRSRASLFFSPPMFHGDRFKSSLLPSSSFPAELRGHASR